MSSDRPASGRTASPSAVIFGCSGPALTQDERGFFRDSDPLGFILFQRNCVDPQQIRALVDELREAAGRPDAPVLIDQEGGRVQRLKPPRWRAAPPAARFAGLWRRDPEAGIRAAWINARLIAAELQPLGITVDCAPVLDLPVDEADPIIGDRAHGDEPIGIAALGRAVAEGLLAGGVLPVAKHLPGHGRASVDSHLACPTVTTPADELSRTDFAPFHALRDLPYGMTAHVVFTAIDPAHVATLSKGVIQTVIRRRIGFDGVLLSDDLSMRALSGTVGSRAAAALAAGCDVLLHCNGDLAEMTEIAANSRPIDAAGLARIDRANALLRPAQPIDRAALLAELDGLLASAAI
ncbi:MAG TPA: beta-N-acetylhexosaminidase [Stellaceae bacterium]|nr:beta-N-acetylhexosaminidase [Stellaceae bacterium]